MRKKSKIILLAVAAIIFIACQTEPPKAAVDLAPMKEELNQMLDKYMDAWNTKNTDVVVAFLSEDCLVCGTDPSEFWDKQKITDYWREYEADTSQHAKFSLQKREIRVAKDGNSAIAIEQSFISGFSPNIQVRVSYNIINKDGNWLFDFINMAFIPKNEDIGKLMAAVN
jgi:uncharacterized protein (TIGR02246 family)